MHLGRDGALFRGPDLDLGLDKATRDFENIEAFKRALRTSSDNNITESLFYERNRCKNNNKAPNLFTGPNFMVNISCLFLNLKLNFYRRLIHGFLTTLFICLSILIVNLCKYIFFLF